MIIITRKKKSQSSGFVEKIALVDFLKKPNEKKVSK